MRFVLLFSTLFSFLVFGGAAPAQEVTIHGFGQANFSARIADAGNARTPAGEKLPDFLLGDERLQLEIARYSSNANMLAKVDLYYDAIERQARLDLREAYVDVTLGKFEFRVGRQIITWGVGDLLFINDVFPKDWVAFLSGKPLQYLKFGSDAINVNFFPGFASLQVVAIPFYQSDVLPTGQRLVAYDPMPAVTVRRERQPELSVKNVQVAGRIYRYVGNFDLSFYAYRGFYGSPPGMLFDPAEETLTFTHPRLNVFGASVQGAFMNGVLSLEGGYYDSRDDPKGTNPGIENSQFRLLVGYQRAFGENLTAGLQYYAERMRDYSRYLTTLPTGFPRRKEVRHTLSLRLTQFLKYQTVRLSFFTFYSPNDEDYYLNPEVRYDLGDGVWIAVGGILLGGKKDYTFFGQFEKNDNVYFVLRYGF
jgi:hypothetical protein